MCRQVSHRSWSLKCQFVHMFWWWSCWIGFMWSTPLHLSWLHLMSTALPCRLQRRISREHSPTRRKNNEIGKYIMPGGLTLLRYRPNTITRSHKPVGPPPASPPCHMVPPERPRGLAWPLPRVHATCAHLRATCAPCGLAWLCHVALCAVSHLRGPAHPVSSARHVSSAGLAENNPLLPF